MCNTPLLLLLAGTVLAGTAQTLENDRYRVTLMPGGSVSISVQNAGAWTFTPDFTVLFTPTDPKLAIRPQTHGSRGLRYNLPSWVSGAGPAPAPARGGVPRGDGFDDRILRGDTEGRTNDLFLAAPLMRVRAESAATAGRSIQWRFSPQPGFRLSASLSLAAGFAEPVLEFEVTPGKPGYYSVGYTGMPAIPIDSADEIWQPMIWQEKRLAARSYLTMAFHCPLPATFVRTKGVAIGVVADPAEFPFDPLPTQYNNRFGVALRNAQGEAQPMIFAPVLGGPESMMEAGTRFRFRSRIVILPQTLDRAFETVAREIYGFRDFRRNVTWSLNDTLDNMVDFGMSRYSWFNEEMKGPSYETDVPGAVKNVSALHPLSLAMVRDSEEIYRRRALPILEFLLSRESLLFSLDPKQTNQSPSSRMNGPCAKPSELAALYRMSQKASPVLLDLARTALGKVKDSTRVRDWFGELMIYRATGDRTYLDLATASAKEYVRRRVGSMQTDIYDPDGDNSSFWNGFVPEWMKLLEMYEETHEAVFLEAAATGARRYAMHTWMSPKIPDTEILVNPGGKAPVYWYLQSKHKPMFSPEERVPAWRLSEVGLVSEGAPTSAGHRAVFLAQHAPWMLRLGYLAKDPFLTEVGRAAVVGRYANFPGYHINTARTTIYEKPDYPLHTFEELSVNSFHYNHIWPHMSLVLDYLVSDTYARSQGQIDFPSQYAEGYAYLQSKVYGDRPGTFFGDRNVWLWMPRKLVEAGSPQLNYIAARGDGRLYLALTNQSPEPVSTELRLNRDFVAYDPARGYSVRMWKENQRAAPGVMKDGRVAIEVAPKGITALAIDGLDIRPASGRPGQDPAPWTEYYKELKVGGTRAMILSMGPGRTEAYIYLRANSAELNSPVLHFKTPAGEMTLRDDAYPYEFSIPLSDGDAAIEFWIEATTPTGERVRSETARLRR